MQSASNYHILTLMLECWILFELVCRCWLSQPPDIFVHIYQSVKDRCTLPVGEQQPGKEDDAVFEDPSFLQSFPHLVVLSLLFVDFCIQIWEES